MNGRKARQLRSQGGQKRFRRNAKQNRVTAAEHNTAMEAMAAERAEQEAAFDELMESLQAEPQFAIVSPFTGEVVMLAAQSMIVPLDMSAMAEEAAASDAALDKFNEAVANLPEVTSEANPDAEAPKIIMPGTAEALGIETP